MDEQLLIQLRDCFTGGYTLPQFCIDNGIKKPLFVAEGKTWQFVWGIYVQFHYDKRMTAQFSFLDVAPCSIHFPAHSGFIKALNIRHISQVKPADVDAVICLTSKKIFSVGRVIYLDALTGYFIRKTYAEIPLLNFLQRHPKVKLILTNFPYISRYEDGVKFSKQLKSFGEFISAIRADNSGNVKTPLDKFGYTNQEVLDIMEAPKITTNLDGSTVMEDTDEISLRRIRNGKRVTAYQPEKYLNTVYFVGSCHHYGVNAPFDKTIESYLQQMLNEHNLPYRVENESQRYFDRYQDIFYNLNKLNPAPGDIIFMWIADLRANNLPFVDVSDAFDPPHDYKEFFVDGGHINELGYKILAEKYFDFLTTNNFFRDVCINHSAPPQCITDTVYRRNTNVAARRTSSMRSWRLTSRHYARREFQSVPSL